jgi:hypothetical protein
MLIISIYLLGDTERQWDEFDSYLGRDGSRGMTRTYDQAVNSRSAYC